MKRLVRAIFFAAVLTFWPERMWGAEAETSHVGQMLVNMEWCLPSDTKLLAFEYSEQSEYLVAQVGGQDFVLRFRDEPWRGIGIRHPESPDFQVTFPTLSQTTDRNVEQITRLLVTGCFALSPPA